MSAPRFFHIKNDHSFVIEVRSYMEIYRIFRYPGNEDRQRTAHYSVWEMEKRVMDGTWVELQPGQELPLLNPPAPSRDRPSTGMEDAW